MVNAHDLPVQGDNPRFTVVMRWASASTPRPPILALRKQARSALPASSSCNF